MCAMDVYRAGAADAVSDKGRPFGGSRLAAQFDELGDGVGVQEAEVRGFDLPALVLSRPGELGKVDGQEGAVDEDVDEVVDELGEDEDGAVGLVEEGCCGGKDVGGAGGPDIEVLPDLGEVREAVPWEVTVALDAARGEVARRVAQYAHDVD